MSGPVHRYVCGFAFAGNAEVALLRKQRPDWQRGRLNGCGGKIEPGETPAEAMRREAVEEIGCDLPWGRFCALSGDGFEVHFFRSEVGDQAEVVTRTDEVVEWHPAGNLPLDALPNLRWLLPMSDPLNRHDWPFEVSERCGGNSAAGRQPEPLPVGEASPFDRIAADRLADAVAALIEVGMLPARGLVADALLDYRNPPQSEESRKMAAEIGEAGLPAPPAAGMAEIETAVREALSQLYTGKYLEEVDREDVELAVLAALRPLLAAAQSPLDFSAGTDARHVLRLIGNEQITAARGAELLAEMQAGGAPELAAFESGAPQLPGSAAPQAEPVADPKRYDISDARLVERAVRNAGRVTSPKRVRWAAVKSVFGTGSTRSVDLCRRFGLDPHADVGLDMEEESDDAG